MSAVRVGVIGAGNWGRNVVRTYHEAGALAGVAEANTALHPALAAEYPGVPLYTDYREMLRTEVPAVVVATPVPTHGAIAREALLAGKDVLVEKPITLSSTEADALADLAQQQGRLLLVGHLLLFQPAVQWLKGYLKSGALGQVYSLHQERLNLGRARAAENALWSLGVHDVAVLLYLLGEAPSQVQAVGHAVLQSGIADDVTVHMAATGGAQAHLHASWLWPEKRRRLTVIGSQGMLVYDELAQTVTLYRKGITPELHNRDEGSEVVFQGSAEPLRLEAEHFLACVAARTPSDLVDGRHGARVVRVLELADASMRKEGEGIARPAPGPGSADTELSG